MLLTLLCYSKAGTWSFVIQWFFNQSHIKNKWKPLKNYLLNFSKSSIVVVQWLSHIWLFATLQTAARQASLSLCSVQFSPHSCLTLCDPMDCSTPGFPVCHQLLALTQTHVHWVSNAIQPSHPLLSLSPPSFNLSQHQGLFQWVGSLHQAKVLEFQLQHQSFQWTPRTDLL